VIRLRHATLAYTDWGCWTAFQDGTGYGAHPPRPDEPGWAHYHVIAHRCGYGDDLIAYAREHELCHLLVEEFLFDRPSRILWGLAHGAPLPAHEAVYEEMAAQAMQRFVRAAERPIIGGVDWDRLGRRFHTLVTPMEDFGC
jgi:hypothetical protein